MARRPAADAEERPETLRQWVRLLLRDLAIFGLIFAIGLGALFAYTQVWPPMVVVESSSMQHSDSESFLGVIDTGDYVLVQATPLRSQIVTWVEGRAQNYRTYGDFGDVIIFRPPPRPADTPIIHRAILWLEWNATTGGGWDAPSLLALSRSEWSARDGSGNPLPYPYNIDGDLTLYNVGYGGDLTRVLPVSVMLPRISGFITMGDNNAYSSGADRWIVPQDHVIGHARGELPWFGLLKLTIAPAGYCCQGWGDPRAPQNSWNALAASLVALVVIPVAADYGLAWWLKRRKTAKGQAGPEDGEASEPDVAPGGASGANGDAGPRNPSE